MTKKEKKKVAAKTTTKKKKKTGAVKKQADGFGKGLGQNWKKARKEKAESSDGNFDDSEIDAGEYVANVTARTGVDKNKHSYIAFNFKISRGDEKGSKLSSFFDLTRESGLLVLMGQIENLGYDPEKVELSDLPTLAEELTASPPEVRLQHVHNGTFRNTYIQGVE